MITSRALYRIDAAFLLNDLSPAYFSDVRELATGVDHYTFIAWAQFSETGTELDIMEPYYEEPCMSSTTPSQSSILSCKGKLCAL